MELARRGKSAEAAAHYRLAIQYGRDLVMGMNNLAWLLATDPSVEVRNAAEAIDMAERASRITEEREPFIMGTLAAAYAEAGRFDEAVRTAGKARDLARSLGMAEVADRNERLSELYRSGKPYREPPLKQ
jgi:tetratricopeptide (TPR) repeat protein